MDDGARSTTKGASARSTSRRALLGRRVSSLLLGLGILFLLAALLYAAYAALNAWLMDQSHFLVSDDVAALSLPEWAALVSPAATPSPPADPAAGAPLPTPALADGEDTKAAAPAVVQDPEPKAPAPVQIRIPAIGVNRSIIHLPAKRDRRTGAMTRDTDKLFRRGRKDLVGHWGGSASPGEEGNTILVGHNYGVGYRGVFVNLGRLKRGQKVFVVNKVGETFTYQVTTVARVPWKRKDDEELLLHWRFLEPGGEERLTLVTCGGSGRAPFPKRVYVVAERVK